MATIDFTITGSYPPFSVELREGIVTGTIVDSMVSTSGGTESFTGVTSGATYYVVVYDNAFGSDNGEKILP